MPSALPNTADSLLAAVDAWAAARGLRCGSDYAALLAWRRHLLGSPPDAAREAECRDMAPRPLRRLHCPACWTELPVGKELDFVACPACGHGMSWLDVEDPHRCERCGAVSEGLPAEESHRDASAASRRAPPCRGPFRRVDYLPFRVIHDAAADGRVLAVVSEAPLEAVARVLAGDFRWIATARGHAGVRDVAEVAAELRSFLG